MNQPLVNALNCAINMLAGTAGGFSPREKQEAKEELEKLLREEVKK